jgi:hypothetical protein
VDYRDDLLNLRTAHKLKMTHLIGGGVDQAAASERRKKHYPQTNHLTRLQQSFCINTNIRAGCWRSNTRM